MGDYGAGQVLCKQSCPFSGFPQERFPTWRKVPPSDPLTLDYIQERFHIMETAARFKTAESALAQSYGSTPNQERSPFTVPHPHAQLCNPAHLLLPASDRVGVCLLPRV